MSFGTRQPKPILEISSPNSWKTCAVRDTIGADRSQLVLVEQLHSGRFVRTSDSLFFHSNTSPHRHNMTQIPESVHAAWADREGPIVLATVDAAGVPNAIYATCVSEYDNETIVVADNYFNKTRANIKSSSPGALLFITKAGKSYQLKGRIEYHTSGSVYDAMKSWNPPQHPGVAAAALRVEKIYSGGEQLA